MINKIQEWFKKQAENYEKFKKEMDRREKQWEKKKNKVIPSGLEKLFESFPLMKFMDYYNPLLVDPDDETEVNRDKNTITYINKIHADLIQTIHDNAIKSRDGQGGRNIRLATAEELDKYQKMTTIQTEIWKVQNDINLIGSFGGIPEVKATHLKKMGVNLGPKVFPSASNVLDPYFPELITIGKNTILGLGASIFCHEFIEGELYVGEVQIGDDCLIGFGSIILPGTKMEKNSILTPGILMSDLKENTMAKGLDGSIRIDKEHSKKLQRREVTELNFTLHDYMKKLIFPKESPLKTALSNVAIEWQKSPLVSQSFRQFLLKSAGICIGNNVTLEDNIHFDTFYPEKISIGNGVIIKNGATILTHEGTVHNFRTGKIQIEDNVVIESGAKILPGVTIGKNSKIYPYAIVMHDIEPDSEVK